MLAEGNDIRAGMYSLRISKEIRNGKN